MNRILKHNIQNFCLQSGTVMPGVTIAYRTLGKMAPGGGNNTVLVTHGYTSGPQMIEPEGDSEISFEGGWSRLVGPGKPIDTNRFFVVCPNMLGSSYGSTNAASINPETGKPYGSAFPYITVKDIVASQRRLLEDLGVKHLVAVAGPSYGGYQAFQWAVDFPDFMDGIVAAVTAPKAAGSRTRSLLSLLKDDPQWNGGDYYEHGPLKDTLMRIREEMLKRYGMDEWLQKAIPERKQRQEALSRMAAAWAEEFDANSLVILSRALENFNTEHYFNTIKAKVLYVLSSTDKLFPPSLGPDVMEKLKKAGVDAGYFEINSEYGHLASGLDADKWADRLSLFINSLL
ncbi:MAG: alpha/beta fold hydrolase [Desulfobacteraceae bacterium]|nr:alpha/beta fold hydrolase [Desulfobacteraceae bacterium]